MNKMNRERKFDIKAISAVQLNDEQKEAKKLIFNNQIVVVTGMAGSGKSLVCSQAALDLLKQKEVECIYSTRATVEVGKSLGYLPGDLKEKFDPYIEALVENINKCCVDKNEAKRLLEHGQIKSIPVQFMRSRTIDDVLIVEEAQNLTKAEMLAILTRLGKHGRIIINGDNNQRDIKDKYTGLSYILELAENISEIKWINLTQNHRSDLIGKILDYEGR